MKYLANLSTETNLGQNTFLGSLAPLTNPRARKSSKENETSSSGLYLSRYGHAIKVSRKAALCASAAAATQCKKLYLNGSHFTLII